eukprot:CAMPEP_0204130192 /NCGR_PEP_ID=MMETSP0361-20130328/13208_1 /ASSEMBLY_ACC=CAM_ASM_000343 /TAXON_ID=268821 /ORGANISM="Scrippsiella Hangoei, Strain SHTV-5" /LENGTH=120 /DNA_ID=CAMNT_0051082717 /DNA_START=92 /DNA_END=449 /DNA_ORIENTATION=+
MEQIRMCTAMKRNAKQKWKTLSSLLALHGADPNVHSDEAECKKNGMPLSSLLASRGMAARVKGLCPTQPELAALRKRCVTDSNTPSTAVHRAQSSSQTKTGSCSARNNYNSTTRSSSKES